MERQISPGSPQAIGEIKLIKVSFLGHSLQVDLRCGTADSHT